MDKLEMVELISKKTGATYEESKNALEATNWDTLDAVLYIEALKKAGGCKASVPEEIKISDAKKEKKHSSFASAFDKFADWCSKVIKRGWEIKFKIMNNDEEKISMPLLVVVLLMFFAFWITIPLLVIGMVCGLKYRFEGIDTVTVNLNDLSDRASKAVDDLKNGYEG